MQAYAVKHIISEQGPLSSIMKEVKKLPYSYTSKEPEATEAARGRDIYVFEVHALGADRTYALGYKYRAFEKFAAAGGGLWKGEFRYKNSSSPCSRPIGIYFEPPLVVENVGIRSWLTRKQPGMAQIPSIVVTELEKLIKTSGWRACLF